MRTLLPLLFLFTLPVSAETLRMHLSTPVVTLDWTGALTMSNAAMVVNLQEGLFTVDPSSAKPIPALAESVTKSKDLKTYTFRIRKDAKWSDGRAVFAKDFVEAWQRVLSPQSSSIYYHYFYDIVNAREYHEKKLAQFDEVGIHEADPLTLVITLSNPQKQWEIKTGFWPFFPVRKDLIGKFGNNWWQPGTLVSTGPFVYDSATGGKQAILKRNPHHTPDGNVDRVEIDFTTDRELILDRYRKNTYPFIHEVNEEKHFKDREFKEIPLLRHHALVFNAGKFPLSNRKFRKAILASVDTKKLLVDSGLKMKPATSLVPESLLKQTEPTAFPFQPEQAKTFLETSGIVVNPTMKVELITSMSESSKKMGEGIASQIGKNLKLPVSSVALNTKEFETYGNLGDYSMILLTWTAKVPEARDFLLPYSKAFLKNNKTRTTINGFDDAVIANNIGYALELVSKEEAVVQPLFFERMGYLSKPRISGLAFDHMGLPHLRKVRLKAK